MVDRPPSAADAALATTAGSSSLPGPGDDDDNSVLSSSSSSATPTASSSDADTHSRLESHSHARFHSHSHYRSHRQRHHGPPSSHRHSHNTGTDAHIDADDRNDSSNRAADENTGKSDSSLELRQADAHDPLPEEDSWETRVVQTIELVQVVDTSGKPLSTSTNYVEPNTVVIDRESGETAAIPPPDPVNTAPAASPEASEDALPPESLPSSSPVTSSTATTQPDPEPEPTQSNASVRSSASSQSPLVPAPSAPPPLPSGGHHNNTIPKNTTVLSEPPSRSSRRKSPAPSTISYTSTTDKESTSSYSKTTYESTYTSWTAEPTATSEVGGWVAGPEGEAGTTQDSNSESGGGGGGGGGDGGIVLSEQQKHIVGGVVGSCAGLAFLVLLVFMALKYKKRRNEVQELIGDQGIRARELAASRGPGGDGGTGPAGAMVERSNAKPFSVPAALASLTGRRSHAPSPPPAATGETGFVRVSGRKLPSVFQHGGDGYTDPRESVMSGASDYYRGSQAFDPGSGSHRLALGAPMRPVSGVPVMRMGPSRTPVTEQNPFADPFADPPSPTSPPPPPDALGRSLVSQDGSRVSASRFQENI